MAEGRHGLQLIKNEFRDLAGSYDLEYTVHAPFSDINIASLNKSIRLASITEIADCIRKGAELGIRKFVVHPGSQSVLASSDRERAFLLAREGIKSLDALAESLDVELFVENMIGTSAIGASAREMKLLLGGTGAGLCLDVAHAFIEKELQSFLEDSSSVGMLHISDNDGVSDSHLGPGAGKMDPAGMLQVIRQLELPPVIETLDLRQGIMGKEALKTQP